MPTREQIQNIDDRWQTLQPGWGRNDYEGERKMLYDALKDGESIERLWGGGWFSRGTGGARDGVVVATGRRLLLLNKGKNMASIPYLGIDTVEQPEPGKVRISGPTDLDRCELDLQWAADEVAEFVRGRMVRDAESLEAALSHVLVEAGERVEHWASCTAGQVEVLHYRGSHGAGGTASRPATWKVSDPKYRGALAVSTNRRILVCAADLGEAPHWTILAADYWVGRILSCVDRGGRMWQLRFKGEAEAAHFAGLIREHQAAAAWSVDKGARISAEWKLQQPIWDYRKDHDKERRKLCEVMEDDEHIERLIWGDYKLQQAKGGKRGGVIAATGRRLLFVSDGLRNKNVSHAPYEGITGLAFDGELAITSMPGYDGYLVSNMDDMSPRDSKKKGYASTFAARLQSLFRAPSRGGAAAPYTPQKEPKEIRILWQWEQQSPNWDLDTHKSEREKLLDVLLDGEDIERLVHGSYKADKKGSKSHKVVVAATDRRLVFVYNGVWGEHVNEMPYRDIVAIDVEEGFWAGSITIAGRPGVDGYIVDGVGNEGAVEFVSCVQSHLQSLPGATYQESDEAPHPSQTVSGESDEAPHPWQTELKEARILLQWEERSPDWWGLNTRKNEREKLLDLLLDDEDIERLVEGDYKADKKGSKSHDVVIAATDRRLVFVYNGVLGEHVNEMPYSDIGSVEAKKGFLSGRITIVGRFGVDGYIVNSVVNDGVEEFVSCVQSHL